EYDYISGKLFFKDTHLHEMFERGRCHVDIDIKTLMMVDSLEMTEADREIIVHNCKRSASNKILITHGTDKMVETSSFLSQSGVEDKRIVLNCAMIPYAFGTSSDGFFNLGSALAIVQTLALGIYVPMNGRYFDWHNVKKNTKTGIFEEL